MRKGAMKNLTPCHVESEEYCFDKERCIDSQYQKYHKKFRHLDSYITPNHSTTMRIIS
eukprot:Awhi_evm1s4192